MTSRARTSHQPMKPPPHHHRLWDQRMEIQGKRQAAESDKAATTSGRTSVGERRLALMQDVDRLKKKLRHEENIQGMKRHEPASWSSASPTAISPSKYSRAFSRDSCVGRGSCQA
ncbi:hypothetical protein Droror1_Dr00027013 [Drosera rotundifolia]